MKETLHCSNGLDETRVRRAFEWVVTFRDFPVGSYQTVDGDSMMTEAITFFTKGRAEFYLDGERRADRVPGVLSSEHEVVGSGGTFTLKYVERTSRVCIPAGMNHGRLPLVKKIEVLQGEPQVLEGKFLVCLGSVHVGDKEVQEERTFKTLGSRTVISSGALLLQFL